MYHSDEYMLEEGRDLLANIGHLHADAYKDIDILEQCAVEGFAWNGSAWVPEDADPPTTPPRKTRTPPPSIAAQLRQRGAPLLPGMEDW